MDLRVASALVMSIGWPNGFSSIFPPTASSESRVASQPSPAADTAKLPIA